MSVIWSGVTEQGAVVPVQVDVSGRVVVTPTTSGDYVLRAGDTMTGNLNASIGLQVIPDGGTPAGLYNGTCPNNGMYITASTATGSAGAIAIQTADQGASNLMLSKKGPATVGSKFLQFAYGGFESGSITLASSTSINYNATSDYRLKENVVPITAAASTLKQLNPCRYNFVTNPELPMLGFLAHEVQEVLPSVVTGTKDAVDEDGENVYQQMDYSKLTPILTAALQEALARIETLETDIQSLKGKSE